MSSIKISARPFEHPWRFDLWTPDADDHPSLRAQLERVMATGPNDASPAHVKYPAGYDGRCDACWLNINHTVEFHRRSIDR